MKFIQTLLLFILIVKKKSGKTLKTIDENKCNI